MSIRMKEWGMIGTPSRAVHLPIQGLMNWDGIAEKTGRGVAALLRGSAELAEGQERVEQTGELAAFSDRLRAIGDETRNELAECEVNDWDHAWRAASEPRLAEAVAELPPSARRAGMELAQAYSRQASVEALRDRSVQSLEKARGQWKSRLENAVEQGDAPQAQQWLELGKGVFVPEGQEAAAAQEVGSRACLSRWRIGLQQDALASLERWQSATPEELPSGQKEQQQLTELMKNAKRSARQTLAQQVSQELQEGRETPPEVWEQAQRAGLVADAQGSRLAAARDTEPSPVQVCRWLRRVDEVEDEGDARSALQLEICRSGLSVSQRRELLKRLEIGSQVGREDRLALSRHLWNLYRRGAFGCPGDAMACRHMENLQRQGLQLLAGEGAEAAAQWVNSRHRSDGRWVCFSDSRKNA